MVPQFLQETVNIWHCQFNIFSERLHISLQDLMFCDSEMLNQFILVHLLWGIRLSMGIKTAVDTKISSKILVTTNRTICCHDQDDHNMPRSLVTVSRDKYSYLSRGLTLAKYQDSRNQHNHCSICCNPEGSPSGNSVWKVSGGHLNCPFPRQIPSLQLSVTMIVLYYN